MLYDPAVWLFALAVGLFVSGILGVVLSTRRVPPSEALEMPGLIPDAGSERQRLALQAEVEKLRAERDELQNVLGRLAVLLDRRHPELAAKRPHLVTTGDDGERRAGGR